MTPLKRNSWKPLSPLQEAIYMASITIGLGLLPCGVFWLQQLGCAIALSAQLISGRFSAGSTFLAGVGWFIVTLAVVVAGWQFSVAHHLGHVLQKFPTPWWWAGFIFTVWASLVWSELTRKSKR